jgi:hypothetical protein
VGIEESWEGIGSAGSTHEGTKMTDREKLLVAMVGEEDAPQPRRLTVFEVAAMLAAQRRMLVGAGAGR